MAPKYVVKKILEFFTERKIRGKVFHSSCSTVVGSRFAGVHGNDITERHLPATIIPELTFCIYGLKYLTSKTIGCVFAEEMFSL